MRSESNLRRLALATALTLGVGLGASSAHAFCRTTTCDVENKDASCSGNTDADGCTVDGSRLYWPDGCTWFGVQKDGSEEEQIGYDVIHPVVAKAFKKWQSVDCPGGGHPSFAFQDTDELYGKAECREHEFNKHAANANVWMFRDADWPYIGQYSTIALTTVTVEITTGRVLDADVEINSWGTDISTSEQNVTADLESIVTHESGHFLGLAHSKDETATMFANYSPANGLSIRSLAPDDIAGICAIYPGNQPEPVCGQPEPLYGFSRNCGGIDPDTDPVPRDTKTAGCSCAFPPTTGGTVWTAAALAVAVGALRRRRFRG